VIENEDVDIFFDGTVKRTWLAVALITSCALQKTDEKTKPNAHKLNRSIAKKVRVLMDSRIEYILVGGFFPSGNLYYLYFRPKTTHDFQLQMIKRTLILAFIVTGFATVSLSQPRWERYDSIYYDNLFRPNFSNLLMPKGYVEVILGNTLQTNNALWRSGSASKLELLRQITYYQATLIANIGVSKSNTFNAGFEAHYMRGYEDADRGSSPLNIFNISPDRYFMREQAVTSVGPRIKWRPFRNNLNFIYSSSFQIPLVKDEEKAKIFGDQYSWGNQFLYSLSTGMFSFFLQDDVYYLFGGSGDQPNRLLNSFNAYAYVIASKHVFPFISAGHSVMFQKTYENSQYFPIGIGLQYQYSLRFALNLHYNQYVWAKNYADWKTLNVGLRGVF